MCAVAVKTSSSAAADMCGSSSVDAMSLMLSVQSFPSKESYKWSTCTSVGSPALFNASVTVSRRSLFADNLDELLQIVLARCISCAL